MISFWLELAVVLLSIVVGVRIGGAGIGLACAFGLCILTFVFHLRPSSPPVDVMLIIISVVTLAGTLQSAGGLDYLVGIAEKILRRNPNHITFIGPLVSYIFTTLAGTAYVSLSVFSVIAEVAYEAKVRPERPIVMSLIASKLAITASPMSAAVVALVVLLAPAGVTLGQVILLTIPTGLIACLVGCLFVYKRGLELEDDPEYQRRLAAGEIEAPRGLIKKEHSSESKLSAWIFFAVVAIVVTMGTFPSLVPHWEVDGKLIRLSSTHTMEMLMLGASFIIALWCKAKPAKIVSGSVFRAGMVGIICVFGAAWMTDTFFTQHKALLVGLCADFVQAYPWVFTLLLSCMAAIILSQGATVAAIMPLGIGLGIPAPYLIAMLAAVNTVFIFPATGSLIGAMAFDQSGTTRIGKFVLNHSFMLPGLVCVITQLILAFLFTWLMM